MITCELIGRLGNHLFQIATTIAHAKRMGTDYSFPDKATGSYTGEVYFPHLPSHRYQNNLGKSYNQHRQWIYNEPSHKYKPLPDYNHMHLNGFWQSEQYFKEYRQEVIQTIFPNRPRDFVPNAVAVHIRLGDYLTFADKHPPVSVEYIDAAMWNIYERFGPQAFHIFSDDRIAAMRMVQQTSFYKERTELHSVIGAFPDHAPIQTLLLMSECAHFIIANSSFSWWGSWLSLNPDKVVIAPKRWFGPGNAHLQQHSIYCENWVVL